MSENKYAAAMGFIQKFGDRAAIETKDVNGQSVREFTIKSNWNGQPLVKVTVWSEYAAVVINEGDFVAVDGKYSQGRSQDGSKVYHNLTAYKLVVIPAAPKAERGTVNTGGSAPVGASEEDPF